MLSSLTLSLMVGAVYVLAKNVAPSAPPSADSGLPVPILASALPSAAVLGDTIDFVVRRNDTLEQIFRQLKLNLDDLTTILQVPDVRRVFSRIKPGDKVTVVHEGGVVQALKRRISDTEVLSVTRGDDGFAAEVVTTPLDVKVVQVRGTIDSSLFAAARAAGVSPENILRLANDIFGWEIDFALDIRPGDRFNLIYEQKYRKGQYIGDGRILAAEFVNDGETHRAVHYASADGGIDNYFSPDGRSMHRQFLRAPLDFTRVSSSFSRARRHPILNTIRRHQGVDYSAPTGTIIKAAGDGRVSFAGVKGGYGNTIVLEHGGRISTLYGHLSRFAPGMHNGRRVRQGETIGHVGSSGAATGPHLHYEYRVSGIHMNPRTVKLPAAAPIPIEYLADFQSRSAVLTADLERGADAVAAAPPAD
jgi:murein DD-endopeptidase MepM/ murein hydrolase activator NlpD